MFKAFAESVDQRPFSGGVAVRDDFAASTGDVYGRVPEEMRAAQSANADVFEDLAIEAGQTSVRDRVHNLLHEGDIYQATQYYADVLDSVDLDDPAQAAFVADLGWELAQRVSNSDPYLAGEILSTLNATFEQQGLSFAGTLFESRLGAEDLDDDQAFAAFLSGLSLKDQTALSGQVDHDQTELSCLAGVSSADWAEEADSPEKVVAEERNARQLYEIAEKRRMEASAHAPMASKPEVEHRRETPKPSFPFAA